MTFSDIAKSNWAYNGAAYCARYGIISGNNSATFGASKPMTREMFVNAIYHLMGEPEVPWSWVSEAKMQFTDFWNCDYQEPMAWAYKNNIVTGTTDTTLSPKGTITREQAVTFLYRFNNLTNYSFSNTSGPNMSSFSDSYKVSNYASIPMYWAIKRYIIRGVGNNVLDPKGTMTKAQCANMIYNFTNVAKYPK